MEDVDGRVNWRKRQESNLPRTPSRPPTVLKTARATGPDALPAPGLAEHAAAAQQDPSVSLAAGCPHFVEIFENLDGQIAPDTRAILEGGGGERTFGRAVGELPRDLGELRQGLRQKEPVVGNPSNTAEALGTTKEALDRLRLERQFGGDLAHPGRAEIADGEQRAD